MKKTILFSATTFLLACLIGFASCKKNTTTPTPTASGPNTITLKIDGKNYTVAGGTSMYVYADTGRNFVYAEVGKNTSESFLNINVQGSPVGGKKPDFYVNLFGSNGPVNGLGDFEILEGGSYQLVENFSGGQAYKLSGKVTVTKNDQTGLECTLLLDAKNDNGSKKITGSLKATQF